MKDLIKITTEQIIKDFGIEEIKDKKISEEKLLRIIANQVAYYLEYDLGFLLSSLYRLDVEEKKIKEKLSNVSEEPTNLVIAKLILERQKQRVLTKHLYKQNTIDGLDKELEY